MASPLELAQQGRKRQVSVYSPGRVMRPPQPPARQPQQPIPMTPVQAALAEAAQSPARQERMQKEAQAAAQAEAEKNMPLWGKGLGIVFGNPVTRTVMNALDYASYPRKAIEVGLGQLATALPEWAENTPATFGLKRIDEEKVRNDPRSIWERIRDPEYGYGQIAKPLSEDDKGIGWLANRAQGLAGDVIYDPTTYLTGGAMKAVEGGGKVAMLGSRGARTAELSGLAARQSEEWLATHADELARIYQRGLSAAKTPEVREALGLVDPQLRFMSVPIPGTQKIAKPVHELGGVLRGAANDSPLYNLARGTKGLETPLRELIGPASGQGDTVRNMTVVALNNIMNEGRSVEAIGNAELRKVFREHIAGKSTKELQQMLVEAETPGVINPLNKLAADIADTYSHVTGRDLEPYKKNPETYLPHVMTAKARRWMAAGSDEAKQFMDKAGIYSDDLLEGSGFLEKSRKLVANADGSEQVIKVGNREMKWTDAKLTDLNEAFRKAFPELGFDLYESRPQVIFEAYISSLSKGAGRDLAVKRLADSPNGLLREMTGELEAERAAYQAALDSQDNAFNALRDTKLEPATASGKAQATIPPLEPKADIPESQFFQRDLSSKSSKLRTEEREAILRGPETKARMKAHAAKTSADRKQLIDDAVKGMQDLQDQAVSEAKGLLPSRMPAEIEKELNAATRKLAALTSDTAVAAQEKSVRSMAKIVAKARSEAAKLGARIESGTRTLERELTTAGNKGAKAAEDAAQAALVKYKEAELRAFNLIRDKGPLEEAIARELELLERPTKLAQAELQEVYRRFPPPITEEQWLEAKRIVDNPGDATVDEFTQASRTLADFNAFMTERNDAVNAAKQKIADLTGEQRATIRRGTINPKAARDPNAPARLPNVSMGEADQPLTVMRARRLASEPDQLQQYIGEAVGRRKAFQSDIPRQAEKGRAAGRLRVTLEKGQKIAELEWRRAQATGEAKRAWTETVARTRKLEEEISSLNAVIELKPEQLAQARLQVDIVNQLIKDAKGTFRVPKKGGNISLNEVRKAMEPLQKVIAQNKDLSDEILNKTEQLLQDSATRWFALRQRDLTEASAQALVNKAKDGSLAKVAIATVNDNWKMLHSGVLKEGDYIVDAKLHGMMQNLFELSKEPGLFGRTFNALTNLFKTYATLSPGFHVRNALSAIFMNTSDGVPLRTQLEAASLWQKFTRGGKEWLFAQPQEVQDAFRVAAATGAGGRFTEAGVAQELANEGNLAGRFYNRAASNRVTRASQRAGERVEGSVRLAPALDSLRQGDSVQAAIQRVKRLHFDYADVSKMDESMKRLIPFWTFMSRNLPLQISQMWTKPRLYQQYQNLIRNFSADDAEFTPDYWSDAGAFNTGLTVPKIPKNALLEANPVSKTLIDTWNRAEGLPVYGSPDLGFTRVKSDVADLEAAVSGENPLGIFSSFNPLLTAPAEYMTRQDFYTGQQFPEDEGFEEPKGWWAPAIEMLARATGNWKNGKVDPRMMNALSSVNPLVSRAERLTPQITGGDEEAMRRQPEAIARFLGLPVRTLTPKQQDNEALRRYYDQLDEQRRQRQLLAPTG